MYLRTPEKFLFHFSYLNVLRVFHAHIESMNFSAHRNVQFQLITRECFPFNVQFGLDRLRLPQKFEFGRIANGIYLCHTPINAIQNGDGMKHAHTLINT